MSWQVTGIRHDAYTSAHRIHVEEEKPPQEQEHYLHPELFGASKEQAVGYHIPPSTTMAGAQPASRLEVARLALIIAELPSFNATCSIADRRRRWPSSCRSTRTTESPAVCHD